METTWPHGRYPSNVHTCNDVNTCTLLSGAQEDGWNNFMNLIRLTCDTPVVLYDGHLSAVFIYDVSLLSSRNVCTLKYYKYENVCRFPTSLCSHPPLHIATSLHLVAFKFTKTIPCILCSSWISRVNWNPTTNFDSDIHVLPSSFHLHIPINSVYQSRPSNGIEQWTHEQ